MGSEVSRNEGIRANLPFVRGRGCPDCRCRAEGLAVTSSRGGGVQTERRCLWRDGDDAAGLTLAVLPP